jgi:hypothetical protein
MQRVYRTVEQAKKAIERKRKIFRQAATDILMSLVQGKV